MLLLDLVRDVRYALRQLRHAPAFAVSALLCLALGIGATTAVFSVVNTILLRPLPYPDSDRLVLLIENVPSTIPGRPPSRRAHTFQQFRDWQSQSKTLTDGIATGGVGQRLVRTPQGVVGLWGTLMSYNAFSVLGIPAAIGRTFNVGDAANPDVVVLSFDTWQRYFDSDPAVVGRVLEFGGGALTGPVMPRLMTVIGVLPPTGVPNGTFDFYWPLVVANPATARVAMIIPMNRLVTSALARERFYALMLGLFAGLAATLAAIGVYGVLTYAVIQRTQEIGVRMAIGAQRGAVLALVLRKGVVLTLIGLTIGLIGAGIGTRVLQGMLFGITPLDPATFLVVSLLFGVVAVFAAYLPARRATKVDALVALRSE